MNNNNEGLNNLKKLEELSVNTDGEILNVPSEKEIGFTPYENGVKEPLGNVPSEKEIGFTPYENGVKEPLGNVNRYNPKESVKSVSNSAVDGYIVIPRHLLPNGGIFYPLGWGFAVRAPLTKEVAAFSTLQNQDTPGVISAVEDLIRKCVKIYDVDYDREISSGEINDGDKLFFLLYIRSLYIPEDNITFPSICGLCHEKFETTLTYKNLKYHEPSLALMDAYDGRSFHLNMGVNISISFRMPTIKNTSRIMKYLTNVYKDEQSGKPRPTDKVAYDKTFQLLVSFLIETGDESVKELMNKYNNICKNEDLLKAYLQIVNKIKIDNLEEIEGVCPHCDSVESNEIQLPSWSKLFIAEVGSGTDYFN